MKRFLIGLSCALLSVAALATGPTALRKRMQASMLLTGTIVVAPDGSVRSHIIDQVEKVPPDVISLVEGNVRQWKFEPVLVNGAPVAAEAKMSFRVVARPVGDDKFSIGINGAQFGQGNPGESISFRNRVNPIYPTVAAQARVSGTVYLLLRVGRQGQVLDVVAEQVNMGVLDSEFQLQRWRPVLAKAATSAAKRWTFNLPTSGAAVDDDEWFARVPVNFGSGPPTADDYGKWETYIPGPRQPISWFDKEQRISSSADAAPDGAITQADRGLHLLTPLDGA
ncbi:energy transducer TonB [Rhodanobacter sp. Root561]|jgi:hypothetical protein|uniref:energy transducer TonB n=1 Tax=Rhodanobacter sp. Root561 TaxID=1736560 RepID=UPI0006FAB3C8|nr:energy transducer TonB [Rhodanobacter sp. Root561]KQZ79674.1 energy transducer TonB [Rhodanobacter sp. Root561]